MYIPEQMCSWSFLVHSYLAHHGTDAIFLPLTRSWGGQGYDEAVGEGQVVTRTGRVRIKIAQLYIRRQLYI